MQTASRGLTLPWDEDLARHGERIALHTPDGPLTYAELADRVEAGAARVAGPRRLAHVIGGSDAATVIALLAAHRAGHVVMLSAPGTAAGRLQAAYPPDIVIAPGERIEINRPRARHQLHPDLALLMSTSGSTGAAKLVRLSAANVRANTEQIVAGLDVREQDCAALTLPLTYCYGLSVLTSHLSVGASVLLTQTSVVDPCFWAAADRAQMTTLPGVPHTFDLLERSGFAERELPPSLRLLTQAGGRMDPDRVRRFAALGERRGFDLVVMYGQCEATARMAILPAHLVAKHPDAVGFSVPDGHFQVVDGEVTFHGPNVMLGYARQPADLALGRTIEALPTGDLGELSSEGLLRITGRCSRFVKVLGHRIDLDVLERRLRDQRWDVRCTGQDDLLVVALRGTLGPDPAPNGPPTTSIVQAATAEACGAPPTLVQVIAVDEFPVLDNAKPDYGALRERARKAPPPVLIDTSSVATLYAQILGGPVRTDSTFVSLGGDSLSYVEASIRLEEQLGTLPPNWHVTPVSTLERIGRCQGCEPGTTTQRSTRRLRWQPMESSIWLRALAIVVIVGTHADLFTVQGTANALLAIAGYQLARFQLRRSDTSDTSRAVLAAAARVVAPTLLVIVIAQLAGGPYLTRNLFLTNWIFGEERLGPPWRFWFIEALLVGLLLVAAISRSARLAEVDRRHPFAWPMSLSLLAFGVFRIPWWDLPVPRMHGSALVVLHLFLLGWALARVATLRQRLIASALTLVMVGTFSWNTVRDAITASVLLVLLWLPTTRVPSPIVPLVRILASASLYIYVIHWQVLPPLTGHPILALAASLAAGVGYWWAWTQVSRQVRRWGWSAPTDRRASTGQRRATPLRSRIKATVTTTSSR